MNKIFFRYFVKNIYDITLKCFNFNHLHLIAIPQIKKLEDKNCSIVSPILKNVWDYLLKNAVLSLPPNRYTKEFDKKRLILQNAKDVKYSYKKILKFAVKKKCSVLKFEIWGDIVENNCQKENPSSKNQTRPS